ncbi:uncharacterized protein BCR38DRAFT_450708 [Pseudomassariella vexata]|uniref:Uncharacterized protein n=1 Tax=Pseudomassariella vexata TaxID=1141098 RepID=A0A1Y2DBV4_9PEZI|nr:uncharacterized protein BCR38DRAFT_450708 [Pseudomassariella vexata]ORY56596.1 hypothetical protein BCR38DRAFT_450708 [Pseudomassariella vexata]
MTMSTSATDGFATSSESTSHDDTANTVKTSFTAISIGWIVGIVVILVFTIGCVVVFFCVIHKRNKRKRETQEQMAKFNPQNIAMYNNSAPYQYAMQSGTTNTTAAVPSPQPSHSLASELQGHIGPPPSELHCRELPLIKEAPNNELHPPRSQDDGLRYELSSESPRIQFIA